MNEKTLSKQKLFIKCMRLTNDSHMELDSFMSEMIFCVLAAAKVSNNKEKITINTKTPFEYIGCGICNIFSFIRSVSLFSFSLSLVLLFEQFLTPSSMHAGQKIERTFLRRVFLFG